MKFKLQGLRMKPFNSEEKQAQKQQEMNPWTTSTTNQANLNYDSK